MANDVAFGEPKVQKFTVTCKTCHITETFYSELNVGRFRSNHLHHEVVMEGPDGRNEETSPATETPVVEGFQAKPVETVLSKVLVDTRLLSLQAEPVLLVEGLKGDGKATFVQTFTLEELPKLREFLDAGRHEERGFSVLGTSEAVYVWEPWAIEFTDDAMQRLIEHGVRWDQGRGAKPTPREPSPVPPKVEQRVEVAPRPPPSRETPRPVAPRVEPKFEQPAPPAPPVVEAPAQVAPPPAVELPQAPPPSGPAPIAPVPEQVGLPPAPKPREEVKEERKPAPPEARPQPSQPPQPPKKVQPEALLLAKSWYIQEGEENMREAARISKILRAFRWNVEPVYTIGVILDDNLSIETNKGEISGTLLKRIEEAGYRLSAVTTTGGKPTAWFKKSANGKAHGSGLAREGDASDQGSPDVTA